MALLRQDPETIESPRQPASLADRLVKRFLVREETSPTVTGASAFPPRPTQLALPLNSRSDAEGGTLPSLFRDMRRIGSVLGYEQASLDQVVPDTTMPSDAPQDRLMRPGNLGLILHEGANGTLAFDWMHWSQAEKADPADDRSPLRPTLALSDLAKGGRTARKLAKRRCVVPLVRYSIPVRDGDVWSHRWITPASGQMVCAAGIWLADRSESPRFALVTGDGGRSAESEVAAGPLLLAETDLLTWLRAPLKDALSGLGRHCSHSS
jgi:putative SOS response-associated peptidase YedK